MARSSWAAKDGAAAGAAFGAGACAAAGAIAAALTAAAEYQRRSTGSHHRRGVRQGILKVAQVFL